MATNLKINELQPGMVIVRVTAQNGPVKIRKSGLVTSSDMVRGLSEMGVQEVEIDPEQTVEIDAPQIEKSQTQKLLERDYAATSKLDNSLSEQFNRSLFLPSVQDIPSVWHYYGKQILVAILVFSGGLGIGWSGANYSTWVDTFVSKQNQATPTANAKTTEPAPQRLSQSPQNQSAANDEAVAQSTEATSPSEQPVNSSETESLDKEQTNSDLAAVEAEPEEPKISISPDLLRRFEAAVAAVDNSPVQEDYQTEVVTLSDVPKIHELPASLLTRLPSMAFSAHMYASEEENRWVRVNGKRVSEGELVEDGLEVVRIEPQHVVMSFRGSEFVMAALTDW